MMILIFLAPSISPIISADANTSARSSPDFKITSFTLDNAGSVLDGADIYVENKTHVTRVIVSNTGSSAGTVSLTLFHRGSPTASESIVKKVDLGSLPSSSTSNPILIQWIASPGDYQTLFARVSSLADTNSANDEKRIDFNVSNPPFLKGGVTNFVIPDPPLGSSITLIPNGPQTFQATVINNGVKDITAEFQLSFSELSNPSNKLSFTSGEVILQPGSLFSPAVSSILSTNFNSGLMTGVWNLTASVVYTGTGGWTSTDIVKQADIRFSDYIAELAKPSDRSTEPGLTTTLTFIVTNKGIKSDSFEISLSSTMGWADISAHGTTTATFSTNASATISVPVTVPIAALRSQIDTITLVLESAGSNPKYSLTSSARVMAGELYQASLTLPTVTTLATPGQMIEFSGTLENTGNVPGSFLLSTGISIGENSWDVELSTYSTGIISDSATSQFSVFITVPPIQNPLVASEHNRAGDVLNVWVQAIPVAGGLPTVSTSQIEVRPVIVVDPGLPFDHYQLTEQEVIDAKNGNGVDLRNLSLDVEVRHNLDTSLPNTVDTTLAVGTITFAPTNSGGFLESDRWSAQASPPSFDNINLGETKIAALGVQGPDDDYPLSGIISIPVTATPTINGATIPNVLVSPVTRTMTIGIPSILSGEVVDKGPFDVPLGEEKALDLSFANTGNDRTSYRLTVLDDYPDGWDISLNTTTAPSSILDNLSANVADYPTLGADHISQFTLTVKTDPFTPAYTIQPINIKVEDRNTGIMIGVVQTVSIRVGPFVNASLSPTNQTVPINTTQMEDSYTRIYLTNTGNAATTYSVWLDDMGSKDVEFLLESPNQFLVAPGVEDSIKIRMITSNEADSDSFYMATVWVSTDTGVNLSANIVANITEMNLLEIDVPSQYGVLPGQQTVVNFTVTNSGNLAEDFDIEASVEGGWEVIPASQSMTLTRGDSVEGSITVKVPDLDSTSELGNGTLHNLTIRLVYSSTDVVAGFAKVKLIISPMFMMESNNWPLAMEFNRQMNRTWQATIVNVGNNDVTVDISYDILKPGLISPSNEWSFVSGPSKLVLPRSSNVSFEFVISATEQNPDLDLEAFLVVSLTPQDDSIEGIEYLNTTLKMSRFFKISDYILKPPNDGEAVTEYLSYSHIPRGASTAVAYELELCQATRLFDFDANGLDAANYPWSFTIIIDEINNTQTSIPLPLINVDCGDNSAGSASRITLPLSEAWNPKLVTISVDMPNPPNIMTEDGWDLTFRLFHPSENSGYTVFDEENFRFELDVFADPTVSEVWISKGTFQEGTDSVLSAKIRNDGTAQALIFEVKAQCSGSTIISSPLPIVFLGPNQETTVQWNLTTDKIDWWAQSIDGTCNVEISAPLLTKNVVGNDKYVYQDEVYSWSPDQSSSFVAFLIFTLLSVILGRLTGQNEKFRLFSVYSGILGLGFAFHLIDILFWGPLVLIIAAITLWRMAWNSTDEFRLIHEDYQRARKGVSTLYADHFQALADSRKQLRIILSLPILGMLGVVIGIPPQLEMDKPNLISLAAYVGIITVGVWILVKRADVLYGGLYGRLTDIEVKATRIERDLGDPARLLNDLANDGIDLSTIFDDPLSDDSKPFENLNIDGFLSDEEVSDDV